MNLMEMLGLGDSGSIKLSEAQMIRLLAWRDRPPVDMELVHPQQRFTVVDVEASGLDLTDDYLLAIGAVSVDRGIIDSAQVFEASLATASDRLPTALPADAIVRTRPAQDPAEALIGFLEFAGRSVLVSHRADFPRTMIERAVQRHLGIEFEPVWLDLAYILPGLFDSTTDFSTSLDQWLSRFSITNPAPHNALADAYVVARLLQRTIARAVADGLSTPEALRDFEQRRRRAPRSY
ncbi:MAG TPA: 3'-5' exonuclease [Rhodocyclaceae bacterium]